MPTWIVVELRRTFFFAECNTTSLAIHIWYIHKTLKVAISLLIATQILYEYYKGYCTMLVHRELDRDSTPSTK